jgi:hypothetical protein
MGFASRFEPSRGQVRQHQRRPVNNASWEPGDLATGTDPAGVMEAATEAGPAALVSGDERHRCSRRRGLHRAR